MALTKAATSRSGGGIVFLRGNVVGKACQPFEPLRGPAVELSSWLGTVVSVLSWERSQDWIGHEETLVTYQDTLSNASSLYWPTYLNDALTSLSNHS